MARSESVAASTIRAAVLVAIAFVLARQARYTFASSVDLPLDLVGLGIVATLFRRGFALRPENVDLSPKQSSARGAALKTALLTLLVVAPAILSVAYITLVAWPNVTPMSFRQEALSEGSASMLYPIVLSDVVAVPLAEEYYFRQVLYIELFRIFRRPPVAVLASAVWFTAIHDPASMPIAFAVGLASATLRTMTGRLPASVLAHALANLATGLVEAR